MQVQPTSMIVGEHLSRNTATYEAERKGQHPKTTAAGSKRKSLKRNTPSPEPSSHWAEEEEPFWLEIDPSVRRIYERAVHDAYLSSADKARLFNYAQGNTALKRVDSFLVDVRPAAEENVTERPVFWQCQRQRRRSSGAVTMSRVLNAYAHHYRKYLRWIERRCHAWMLCYDLEAINEDTGVFDISALYEYQAGSGVVEGLLNRAADALTPPSVRHAAESCAAAARAHEATMTEAGRVVSEAKTSVEAVGAILKTIASIFEGVHNTVSGVNMVELSFAIADIYAHFNKPRQSVAASLYASINCVSRVMSAFGYSATDALAVAYHWCTTANATKDVSEVALVGTTFDMEALDPLSVGRSLVSVLLTGFLGTSLGENHLKTAVQYLNLNFAIGRSMTMYSSIVDTITDTLPCVLNAVVCTLLPSRFAAWFYTPAVFRAWVADIDEVLQYGDNFKLLQEREVQLKIIETYVRFRDMLQERDEVLKMRPTEFRLLYDKFLKLTSMFRAVSSMFESSKARPAPTVIWMCGDPGIGKSSLLPLLLMKLTGTKDYHSRVHFHNVQSKHWNGYFGQDIVVLEEVCNNIQEHGLADFTALVNSSPFMPEMADLNPGPSGAPKGTFVNVKIVIVVCNYAHPKPPDIAFPDAIFRRRDVLAKFCLRAGLGSITAASHEELERYDHLRWQLLHPTVPQLSKPDLYTVRQFVQYVADVHEYKQAREQKLMSGDGAAAFLRALGEELTPADRLPVSLYEESFQGEFKYHLKSRTKMAELSADEVTYNARRPDPGDYAPFLDASGSDFEHEAGSATHADVAMALAKANGTEGEFDKECESRTASEICGYGPRLRTILKVLLSAGVLVGAVALAARLFGSSSDFDAEGYTLRDHGSAAPRARPAPAKPRAVDRDYHAAPSETTEKESLKLSENVVRLRIGGNHGGGFMLSGRYLVTARHMLFDANGDVITKDTDARIVLSDNRAVDFVLRPKMIVRMWKLDDDRWLDAAVVNLATILPNEFTDIRSRFWTPKEMAAFQRGNWFFISVRGQRWREIACSNVALLEAPATAGMRGRVYTALGDTGVTYRAHSTAGDSGSLLFNDCRDRYRLVGLHSGGRDGTCYGQMLTSDMFDGLDPGAPRNFYDQYVCEASIPAVAGLRSVGRLRDDCPNRAPEKTKLRRTAIADFVPPCGKEPARLRPFRAVDGTIVHPMNMAVAKLGAKTRQPIDALVQTAAADVVDCLAGQMRGMDVSTLSDDEAMFGTDQPYVDRMNPNASAGLPFRWSHPGQKGKRHLVDFDNKRVIDEELVSMFRAREAAYRRGESFGNLVAGTLKDELRTLDRVEAGKTRLFQILGLDSNWVARKYLLRFCAALYGSRTAESESQVGINPTSDEWSNMALDMLKVGKRGFCSDSQNHDGMMDVYWGRVVCDYVVIPLLRRLNPAFTDEDAAAIHAMNDDWLFAYIAVGSYVYQKWGVLPTGASITVVWNTLLDMVVRRYVWLAAIQDGRLVTGSDAEADELDALFTEAAPAIHALRAACRGLTALEAYHRYTRCKYYGDDNSSTVAEAVAHCWHFQTYRLLMAIYMGWVVTPPDKSEDRTYTLVPLEEFDFLKRGFRWDESLCSFGPVAPLTHSSIVARLQWQHCVGDEFDLLRDNCVGALREMTLWGRDRYNELRAQLLDAFAIIGERVTLPTWAEMRQQYRDGLFDNDYCNVAYDFESSRGRVSQAALKGTQSVKDAGSAASNAADAVGKVEGALSGAFDLVSNPLNLLDALFDKPNVPGDSTRVVKVLPPMAHLKGTTNHDVLGPYSDMQHLVDPASVGTEEDEASLLTIARQPCIVSLVTVDMLTVAAGDLLYSFEVGPMGELIGTYTNHSWVVSRLCYACMFVRFVRGSIMVVIDLFAPQQVSGKLLVHYRPQYLTVPTWEEAQEGYFRLIDVNTDHQQFVLEFPYIRDRPLLPIIPDSNPSVADIMGRVSIFAASTFNAPSTVNSTWQFAVSKAAGANFQFFDVSEVPGTFTTQRGFTSEEPDYVFESERPRSVGVPDADDPNSEASDDDQVVPEAAEGAAQLATLFAQSQAGLEALDAGHRQRAEREWSRILADVQALTESGEIADEMEAFTIAMQAADFLRRLADGTFAERAVVRQPSAAWSGFVSPTQPRNSTVVGVASRVWGDDAYMFEAVENRFAALAVESAPESETASFSGWEPPPYVDDRPPEYESDVPPDYEFESNGGRTAGAPNAQTDTAIAVPNETPEMTTVETFGAAISAQPSTVDASVTHADVITVGSTDVDAEYTVAKAASKVSLLDTVNLSTGDTVGLIKATYDLPQDVWAANRTVRAGVAAAQYWTGSIVLTATATGSRFSSGAYAVAALPVPADGAFPTSLDLCFMSSLPHVVARVATGQTVTLTLPWKSPYSALRTKGGQPVNVLYKVVVVCVAPLREGAGSFGGAQLNVYAQLIDSKFSVPEPSGITYTFEADMSAAMGVQELSTHEGASVSASGAPAAPRSVASEVRSLHEIMKRFGPGYVLDLPGANSTFPGLRLYGGIMSVGYLLQTSALKRVIDCFRLRQGEINLKVRFGRTYKIVRVVTRQEPAVAPPETSGVQQVGSSWTAVVGYCPFAVASRYASSSGDLLQAFAASFFKTTNSGSGFLTLAVCDDQHPWVQAVVPFTTDLHNVCTFTWTELSTSACPLTDSGVLIFMMLAPDDSVSPYGMYTATVYTAAGDSFRLNAWAGTPSVNFTASPSGGSGFPSRIDGQ